MRGTLDTFSLVEVLQLLSRGKSSGTLHIECPNRQIDVNFAAGRIARTHDSTRVATDAALGSQLLKRSLVNEAQLNDALATQERSPRPLGTLLVESGAMRSSDLEEVLSRQLANTLVAARLETTGSYMFVADAGVTHADFITIDTHSVLVEISTLGGEYCLAVEALGRADTVLALNGDYATLPRSPMLMGRDEFAVLARIDGRRSVSEVARECGLEELTVISVLGKLAESGVVLVRGGHQTRAEDDEDLRAHRDSVWAEISQLLDDAAGGEAGPAAGDPSAG